MYKFNSGYGAIICNVCNIIIDSGFGPDEAEEVYGPEPHYCWKHKPKESEEDGKGK